MKYNEDNILNEVGEYISSTYDQHYVGTKNIQTIDVWDNLDMAEEMCLGTLLKYAMRFGKKGGKKGGKKKGKKGKGKGDGPPEYVKGKGKGKGKGQNAIPILGKGSMGALEAGYCDPQWGQSWTDDD